MANMHDDCVYPSVARCANEPVVLFRTNTALCLKQLRMVDASPDLRMHDGVAADALPPVAALLAAEQRARHGLAYLPLNLLRVAAASHPESCAVVASQLTRILHQHVFSENATYQERIMALRVAVNAFAYPPGVAQIMSHRALGVLVEAVAVSLAEGDLPVVKVGAALAFNLAGACRNARTANGVALGEGHQVQLLFAALRLANKQGTPTSMALPLRLLGCIACLVDGDPTAREIVLAIGLHLDSYTNATRCPDQEARAVAIELGKLLQR